VKASVKVDYDMAILNIAEKQSNFLYNMSKAGNKKRAKLLRQRKKERERQTLLNAAMQKDQEFLHEKVEKENIKIIDRALLGRKEKISSLLIEMIEPVLYTASDEEEARGIVSMGISAWNCGIIKQLFGEEKLEAALKKFKGKKYSEERQLLDEYIDIKCNKYSLYNDYITDFKISFEIDGSMNLTVLTGVPGNIKTL
jgi:hypothetical protein